MISRISLLALSLSLLTPAGGHGSPVGDFVSDLGVTPGAVLSMRFEVTFMKIDVADLEALLDAETATRLAPEARSGKWSGDTEERMRAVIMEGESLAVRSTILKGTGLGRYLSGTRSNLEAARDGGAITPEEFVTVWRDFETDLMRLEQRGLKAGDVIIHRVDGTRARILWSNASEDVLLDARYQGEAYCRGVKGIYFAKKSSFGKKLMRSLVEPSR